MSPGIEADVRIVLGDFRIEVRLDLPGQGVTALFGPSGSGKTTLLRWFAGLQPGVRGRLVVNGSCWEDADRGLFLAAHQRALGYVFQETTLFPHLDVRANLEFGWRRIAPAQRRVALAQACELLGIGHLLERRTRGLSGGERQRIGIARALLTSPQLLLLDEPLAALDPARKQEILPYLERLHRELDIPVILVSHAPDEVARLADHIVVLDHGEVRAAGPLSDTLARLDLPVRLGEDAGVVLEGAIAQRDAQWQLAAIDTPAGRLWVRDSGAAVGQCARLRILARDVSLALDATHSSITNNLPGTVQALAEDDHPALLMVSVRVGDADVLARVTRRSAAGLGLTPGQTVLVQVKAVAVL